MNRYYAFTTGRFTSPGPYIASGGPSDPGSWNRYGYVGGDPMNWMDPQGNVKCGPLDPDGVNVTCTGYPEHDFPEYSEPGIGDPPSTRGPATRVRSKECDDLLAKAPEGFSSAFDGSALDITASLSPSPEIAALFAVTWWAENRFATTNVKNNLNGPAYGPMQLTYWVASSVMKQGFEVSKVYGTPGRTIFDGDLWANLAAGMSVLTELHSKYGDKAAGYYRTGDGNWSRTKTGKEAFVERQSLFDSTGSNLRHFLKDCITR